MSFTTLIAVKLLVPAVVFQPASAKKYQPCELAEELVKNNINASLVPTFVCLADTLSKLQTDHRTRIIDGNGSFGLFSISSKFWCCRTLICAEGCSQLCKVSCESLIYDIGAVSNCIRTIYDRHQKSHGDGFQAWGSTYYNKCNPPAAKYTDCPSVT